MAEEPIINTAGSRYDVTITAVFDLDCMIDKYQSGVLSTTCDSPIDPIDGLNIDRVHRRLLRRLSSWSVLIRTLGDS